MSVFSYEWKKLMVMQRGLLYILAAVLVSTVWLAAADRPQNSAMEEYREEYEWYLERLDGAYTEEKAHPAAGKLLQQSDHGGTV